MCEQWAISTPFSLSLSLSLVLSCWLLPLMSVNVSFVPQTAATRALIAFELKSTAKTNNKVQNVKCVTAGEQGRGDVGWAQLLRSSKFAGSEQTVNWASNPNKQFSIDPPAMHLVQFDNNAGAKEHSEANKRLTIAIAIAIARCKWSYALRLWCASAYASTPPPSSPFATRNYLRATAAATLSEPMWQTDLVTIIYSYVLRCLSRTWQSHLSRS